MPRLRDDVRLEVAYSDADAHGTLISGKALQELDQRIARVRRAAERDGMQALLRDSDRVLRELFQGPALGDYFEGAGCLQERRLYPERQAARPASLNVTGSFLPSASSIALPAELVPELARWLGEWQRGATPPAAPAARRLWTALAELGCFAETSLRGSALRLEETTFVGHACVAIVLAGMQVLVDPFLLPQSPAYPADYQPIPLSALAPDLILITHSHADHFDLGSLLRFGAETRILVPRVERESLLSLDMEYRLRELGFSRVEVLDWWQSCSIAGLTVTALPFYGEQPCTDEVLHPEVRNCGNTYRISGAGRSFAVTADAGRDALGDTRALATRSCTQHGPVDVVFGGYRSWALYPLQYLFTSVPFHLLFVPPSARRARQQIMNDAHALLDTVERWGASAVVPYADGGAPWYWELDLGPRLDGQRAPNEHLDPSPYAVARAARARSSTHEELLPAQLTVHTLHPGESLCFEGKGTTGVLKNPGHSWPYGPGASEADGVTLVAGDAREPSGLTRKRVLLRILARQELARRGLEVPAQEVQELANNLRRLFRLSSREEMLEWLSRARLSQGQFAEIVGDWAGVDSVEALFADEIEQKLPGQQAFATMSSASLSSASLSLASPALASPALASPAAAPLAFAPCAAPGQEVA